LSVEKLLFSKQKEQLANNKQLQILKNYPGCQQCGSQEVDTYELYENSKLVCQPYLMKKEGGSSSPISFTEQQKWYKKCWKIELAEWLEDYQSLPVNADCAGKWRADKQHLPNTCYCLEREAKESYLLFANSLKEKREKLEKECKCEISNKPRTPYYDSANYGYTYCENCESKIKGAGKMGVIKNRNDPKF
jgi:hypothetical protein